MPVVALENKIAELGFGVAVARPQETPPLSVRRIVPSRSSRNPVFRVGKSTPAIGFGHELSLPAHGRRAKVRPESSERRSTHWPATITVLGATASTRISSAVVPLGSPVQVAPPSSLRNTVPKLPTA
jgi:hypothetical protein